MQTTVNILCLLVILIYIIIANHIKKLDGWSGLYRGLLPRVYSSMIGTLVNHTVLQVRKYLYTLPVTTTFAP